MTLTDRQRAVVAYMNSFRAVNQCNPTYAEIALHFGWRSTTAASTHLEALERKRVLRHRGVFVSKARGFIVCPPWDTLVEEPA